MINIFEVFLPQLLRYPNPADPLNGEAASLLLREPQAYENRVREYVLRFASEVGNFSENNHQPQQQNEEEEHEENEVSSISTFSDQELADAMDI